MKTASILFLSGVALAVVAVVSLFGPGWGALLAAAVLMWLGISVYLEARPAR